MKKRMLALLMALTLMASSTVLSFAQNPTTLEAPQNVFARIDENQSINIRWQIPKSVIDYAESSDGLVYYVVDWKKNNGPWHFNGAINETVLDLADKNNALVM